MRRKPRSPEASPLQEQIPEAELEVLAAVRELGETTAADLRTRLAPFRPMSHASVSTLLQRLTARGLIRRRKAKVGKAYLYRTGDRASAPLGREVGRVLHRLFASDSARLVESLLGQHQPGREELERLKSLVDELYEEQRQEEDR